MIPSPQQLNLPHDDWRPGQYEAVQAIQNSRKPIVLLDAVTGSGKTSLALALGNNGKSVRALTFTRSLQAQYATYPRTQALYGLNAYPCELLNNIMTADMCAFGSNMLKCDHAASGRCQYVNQREITRISDRQALSYQYYFNASWVHKENAVADYLYCDEAHSLPQVIMNQITLELEPHVLSRLNLAPIPNMPDAQPVMYRFTTAWLWVLVDQLKSQLDELPEESHELKIIRRKKALSSLLTSIKVVVEAMEDNADAFYIHLNEERIKIFPLTPAPFFGYLFNVDPDMTRIVMASATIGNHREFAGLLGINKHSYESHIVPPVYSAEAQPVFYYADGPRMGHKSGVSEQKKQIELIRQAIDQFPPDAHALIHFASIKTAKEYARILTNYYDNRVWMPDESHSTEEKLAAWELQKKKQSGTICLAWSMNVGVDAPDVSINILQKVPYLPLDPVNTELLRNNPKLYQWLAAINLEQGAGRIRRGDPSHYEVTGEPMKKFVSIIDNNFHMIKRYFSDMFRSQLTKVQ